MSDLRKGKHGGKNTKMADNIEGAKIQRTSAKSRFTRKLKEFLKAVDEDKGLEIVNRTFEELNEAWSIVESKHDTYVEFIKEEEQAKAAAWIGELQQNFGSAMEKEIKYKQTKTAVDKKIEEEGRQQEAARKEQENFQKMIEHALVKRKITESVREQLIQDVQTLITGESVNTALEKAQNSLDLAVADCKQANLKYLELLDKDKADAEIDWTRKIQSEYNKVTSNIAVVMAKNNEKLLKEKSTSQGKQLNVRLEKLKMPTFDGNIRQYPRFKRNFETQVLPSVSKESAPYALRSCLTKEALGVVRSVDDNIDEMLKRLDEKYGDPAKIADVVIDSIKRVKVIKEGDHEKFIEFVDVVEDAYRDLLRLGLEREITTTSSVSIIKKTLPPDIRKEWAKLVSFDTSEVDKKDKFPNLLKFLLNHKRAIEYDSSNIRSKNTQSVGGAVHLTGAERARDRENPGECENNQNNDGHNSQDNKCLFHPNSDHWTDECSHYLSKSVEERFRMLKEKKQHVGHV